MQQKKTEPEDAAQKLKDMRYKSAVRALSELDNEQIEDIILGGEKELSSRDPEEAGGGILHIADIADQVEKNTKNWGKVTGISTGYPSLDARIGGLKKGELILIGGETNNGKSAVAANIAVQVARNHGVLYITLEMLMAEELAPRLRHINGGRVDNLDLMYQAKYKLDYRDIEPLFKEAKETGKVELVVLDYLQYLGRGMTLDEVAKMSQILKRLALEYKVPFIVIVSLRKGESGKNKRKWTDIEVEDLMGTSAIGYDADVALVVSRKDTDNKYDENHVWLKIIKARNMPIDFDNRYLSFLWDKTKMSEDWTKTPVSKEVESGIAKEYRLGEEDELPKQHSILPYKD